MDVVLESSGKFRTREAAGARKVIITAPGKKVDATIVMGVNEDVYDPGSHHVVSMLWVLHDAFGVVNGVMTTIHSYTNDQNLLDGPHKDPRRARSAAVNMIPRARARRSRSARCCQSGIIGDPASCVFDAGLTTVERDLVKVFGWYDNEWGYANRTLDLAHLMARTM